MRRRALLSSLAATTTVALAGCASDAGDDVVTTEPTDDPATSTDPGTTTGSEPSGEPEGYASVVDLETGARTYSLAPTGFRTDDGAEVALWFDRTGTDKHPPRVRGWLENTNDYENTFEVQWLPVVGDGHGSQPRGDDHEARLHFAPTANNDLAATVPDVVRDDSGFWRVADVGPWLVDRRRLDPGERLRLEYVLVGEPGMSGRPTGTYEFHGRDDTVRVAVWQTDEPGPDAASRFAGRSVPRLDADATVQWFHEADAETKAYVQPREERVDLDAAVEFEVVNHSREALQCGHWNLHKLVDGEWFHVAPVVHTDDCRVLHPGDRRAWTLRAFNADAVGCECSAGCRDGLTRGHLGGGEYAVVAGYGYPHGESAALVELVGDPVEIALTPDASVSVADSVATVTTERYEDGERPADASFEVTRADAAEERLLPEQVMADGTVSYFRRGLRNGLAPMGGDVDRVVVRTDERAVDNALGDETGARRVEVRGQAYEVARVEDATGAN